jgi:hypothetical protein
MAPMARRNGDEALKAAMTQLIQNQAALVAQHTVFLSQMAEMRREFDEIKALLLHHQRILQDLPEALKRTIGFKSK